MVLAGVNAGAAPELLGVKTRILVGRRGITQSIADSSRPSDQSMAFETSVVSPSESVPAPAPILTAALYMFGCDAVVPAKRGESL